MSTWPPPPDLESIAELVANADIEGFIADGAPADEYEGEAEAIHNALAGWATAELTRPRIAAALELVWRRSFSLDDAAYEGRRNGVEALAAEIAHYFGPEAQPRVRGQR
ncbi:MAG: hypothetical protein KGK08_05170 [Acidobacteriota bacterium]|nr:hypothetical protein [Acidobacteriota bacterium]